jgi:hypothetical protein
VGLIDLWESGEITDVVAGARAGLHLTADGRVSSVSDTGGGAGGGHHPHSSSSNLLHGNYENGGGGLNGHGHYGHDGSHDINGIHGVNPLLRGVPTVGSLVDVQGVGLYDPRHPTMLLQCRVAVQWMDGT